MEIKFGPSGNSDSFYAEGKKNTLEAPKWLKEKGLNAFEYSFGKGYLMSSETAIKLGEAFENENITLSLHAPYFINFANPNEEMYEKTKSYFYTGIKFMNNMKANRLIFHPGSCGKQERDDALKLVDLRMRSFCDELNKDNLLNNLFLCPETMGKYMQIGTWKEIIDLCTIDSHLLPTFDFGHINCVMQGGLNSVEEYKKIFDYCFEKLGEERTKNCHVHFSKIQYSSKGEIKHLTFDDQTYGPNFEPFAETIALYNLTPHILCESKGTMAEDAIIMKEICKKFIDK